MLTRRPDSTGDNDLYETPEVATLALLARRGAAADDRSQLRNHQQGVRCNAHGEFLHLQFQVGQLPWSLSGDLSVLAAVAAILITNVRVAPADRTLFVDLPALTWR